jgi:hypothetical protein
MAMRTFHLVIAASLTGPSLAAQSIDTGMVRPVGRGAAVMGVGGAVALGLAGAWVSHGICDAADCTGAWREGIGPGAILGAFLGGAVGVMGGLAQPARPREPNRPVSRVRIRASPGIGIVSNQGHVRTLLGLTAGVEVPAGALSADLQGWLAGLGGFTWSNPGYVVVADPGFPDALVDGQVTDAYVVPMLGFGFSYAANRSTSIHMEMRFHHRLAEGDFFLNRTWAPFTIGVSHRLGG